MKCAARCLATAAVLVATMSTIVHSQQPALNTGQRQGGAEQATPAQRLMGDIAPKLAELTDKVLFGDVWEHPGALEARSQPGDGQCVDRDEPARSDSLSPGAGA